MSLLLWSCDLMTSSRRNTWVFRLSSFKNTRKLPKLTSNSWNNLEWPQSCSNDSTFNQPRSFIHPSQSSRSQSTRKQCFLSSIAIFSPPNDFCCSAYLRRAINFQIEEIFNKPFMYDSLIRSITIGNCLMSVSADGIEKRRSVCFRSNTNDAINWFHAKWLIVIVYYMQSSRSIPSAPQTVTKWILICTAFMRLNK